MDVKERTSYLRGLAEGINLDENNPEHKLIASLIDAIGEISDELESIRCHMDAIEQDLEMLEDEVGLMSDDFEDFLSDDYDDEHECGHGCCCEGDEFDTLELDCPACGESIDIDEEMFSSGRFSCPHCSESLEIDMGDDDDCFCDDDKADEE
ncbi:MAG: CD1247 N-terminal domain-containing protein [Eubacteriales bacterium]|jgi:hypothetical protein